MAWLSGWSYRKEITITGQSGAGTDFQVEFNIGDSAGGDFHLEGHCTNFPQDIAVTDNDETTPISYWIEDVTADPIKMWVEVADDLGSNQIIYIYYGKSGATTDSNIEDTFLFGDDFPGSSVDTDKWTVTGSPSVSSSIITCTGAGAYERVLSKSTFGQNTICEICGQIPTPSTSSSEGFGFGAGADKTAYFLAGYPSINKLNAYSYSDGPEGTDLGTGYTSYLRFKIIRNGSTNVLFYINDDLKATHSSKVPLLDASVDILAYQNTRTTNVDYIFVRKYNSPEPAFSSAGSEDTPPTGASPTAVFYGPLVGPLGGPL